MVAQSTTQWWTAIKFVGCCGTQVGEASTLVIPGRPSKFQKEKVLRAFVKAEGPTCVLLIVDAEVRAPAEPAYLGEIHRGLAPVLHA
jgi:hypothetical protein